MPYAPIDPVLIRFVEQISAGVRSTAALLIRLAARVVKLEKSQALQDAKLAKLTKLTARSSLIKTGVDVRDGGAA